MKFVIATNNKKKLSELSAILRGLGIEALSMADAGVTAEIEENGSTFEQNSMIKAKTVSSLTGLAAVADDSGLCVDALDGQPGIYSARFGGDRCHSDAERTALLLKSMSEIPEEKRTARFVSAISCVIPNKCEFSVRGECEGTIIFEPQGENGFGYDPVFYVEQYGKTFAELDTDIKNSISHRAHALIKFSEKLKEQLI